MPARTVKLSDSPCGRNVVLGDYYGDVLAGFFQYGTVSWNAFFKWLSKIFVTSKEWIIVKGDRFAAEQYSATTAIVMPGRYILLAADGSPMHVDLTSGHARRRQHTPTRTRQCDGNFDRVADRDGKCMVYGQKLIWNKLQPSHIFSRAHATEWNTMGYPSLITDTASTTTMGGLSKIGSVQNLLLLSSDLHSPWADYAFGVDPDDEYRITAFVPGLDGIAGRALHLDHISDPTKRPLDELLRDHFMQGLLQHVKGPGERQWDYARTFGIGAFDLSDNAVWGTDEGKERLEVELENRLFEHRLRQDGGVGVDLHSGSDSDVGVDVDSQLDADGHCVLQNQRVSVSAV